MPHEAPNMVDEPAVPEQAAAPAVDRYPRPSLRQLGKNVLAITGMSVVALLATAPAVAATPNHADNHAGLRAEPSPLDNPTGGDTAPAAPGPAATVTDPTISPDTTAGPEVGIATYNSSSDDPHLYSDMQAVGMTVVRESISREQSQHDVAMVRRDIKTADAHGEQIVVDLGQGPETSLQGFPHWAALTAASLPHVERFVILNEPNDQQHFFDHSMEDYVDTLYKTNVAIHALRPDAIVSGFGLASGYAPFQYLEEASQYAQKYGGLANIMNRLSVHAYRRPVANEALILQYSSIWPGGIDIDEFGSIVRNSGQPQNLPGYVTRSEQAQDNLAFMTWAQLMPQIGTILNYRMQNSTDPLDLKTGLITVHGSRLPAYHAVGDFTGGLDADASASSLLSMPVSEAQLLTLHRRAMPGLRVPPGLNHGGRVLLGRMIKLQENFPVQATTEP